MSIFRKAVGGNRAALARDLLQNNKNVKVIVEDNDWKIVQVLKQYFDDKINRVRKEIADDLNNKIAAEKNDVKSHITNEITEVKKYYTAQLQLQLQHQQQLPKSKLFLFLEVSGVLGV